MDDEKTMIPAERKIVQSLTKKDCINEQCRHCEHTDTHDAKLHYRLRYSETCRSDIFHKVQEQQEFEFNQKIKRMRAEATQEFMATGRVYHTDPAHFEYIHLNTSKKFTSAHSNLDEAVAKYVADENRDQLMNEQLMNEDLKLRCETKAKAMITALYDNYRENKIEELREKLARIEKYNSDEFMFIDIASPIGPKYKYIHLNDEMIFESEHPKIKDAIDEHLKTCECGETIGDTLPLELDENLKFIFAYNITETIIQNFISTTK